MKLSLIEPPAEMPVGVDQLKAHLRYDDNDADDYLAHCLAVAVALVDGDDGELGVALLRQIWREEFEPGQAAKTEFELTLSPVLEVNTVEVKGADGNWQVVDVGTWKMVDRYGRTSVVLPEAVSCALRVSYSAGYGDTAADVPAPIRHAVLLWAAHLFEVREPVVFGERPVEVPLSINRLIAPYRVWWR